MKNVSIGSAATSTDYICPFEGLYICMCAAWKVTGTTTCNAGTIIRSKQVGGSRMSIIYAESGATITMSTGGSTDVVGLHSYYYVSGFKTALTDFEIDASVNSGTTIRQEWANNAANVMCGCTAATGGFSNISSSFEGNISANYNNSARYSFVTIPESSYCSYAITGSGYHNGGVAYITLE